MVPAAMILFAVIGIGLFTLFCYEIYRHGGPIERISRAWSKGRAKGRQDSGFSVRLTPSFADHLERCRKAGLTDEQAIQAWRRP